MGINKSMVPKNSKNKVVPTDLHKLEQSFFDPEVLTVMEFNFCENFAVDLNARQAVIRAGYKGTPESASVYASGLLRKPNVQAYIRVLQARQQQRLQLSSDFVVLGLKEVALRCMQKAPVMEFDPDFKTTVQKTDEQGRDVWEFDSNGANKAFELLGKHLGVFEKDNLQKRVTFNVALVKNTNVNSNE